MDDKSMKVDLHLHSKYSWDSNVEITEYISVAEKLGFGAISITDHNDTRSHNEIRKLQKTTEVKLIPGQEISTSDGHLLIYGWINDLPSGLSMEQTVELAKQKGGICIAAHPFDPFRGGKGQRILHSGIDGIEILNASSWFSFPNKKAQKAKLKNPELVGVGNSDSHRVEEFGSAHSILQDHSEISLENLLSSLFNCEIGGNRIGIGRKLYRLITRKLN